MIVVGIDPGYAIVGYGVVEYQANRFRVIDYGAVTTEAAVPFARRLETIWDQLELLLQRHRPDVMSLEKLFFTTNQKTAIDVAQARGVIQLAAVKRGLPVFEYTPLQIKQAVVGYGKAEKQQVMQMTKTLLRLEKAPKPDDVADALAVAVCHCHSANSRLPRR